MLSNQIKKTLLAGVMAGASLCSFAQGQSIDNPVTQAMLEVYNQELATNPANVDILLRRANEYYKFNQYLRALADVDMALANAPEKERAVRFEAFMLRADIYQMLGKHENALADFTSAYSLDPTSYMALYQKANEEYELGRYAEAKQSYTRLRSMNPRSVEALTGLARVAVKENNIGLASEYMDGAVEMMSADSDIYIRRSSVRRMQGNTTGAVEDLLMAISIDNNPRAFQEIIDIANSDYPAVISGLSTSISYAPQQGMLYYIRGFIAQAHDHYAQALADYRRLIDQQMYEYAGLYQSIAQCELALCRYPQALADINNALSMNDRTGEFYFTKARILFAQGKYDEARHQLDESIAKGYNSQKTDQLKALIDFQTKEYADANDIYASLIIDQPDVMKHYIMRAWVLAEGMKQTQPAASLYNRVINLTEDEVFTEALSAVNSYRGFALLFAGKKDDAIKWGEDLQRDWRDTDGYLSFIATCLYAQAGETDRAFSALEKALQLGYGNLYEITTADFGRISLAPVRSDARFNRLLGKYSHLFE